MKYKEIEEFFNNLLAKTGVFFSDDQMKKFLIKLKETTKKFSGNKIILAYVKRKLEEIK
jgi:hypothetical protein